VLYADELAQRADEDGLLVDLIHTRTAPPGSVRPAGRVNQTDLAPPPHAARPDQPPARAYVCGPTPFVEHAIGALLRLGHTNRSIRAERFGPTGA
jgi:ferredoxin-NADP reductase